MYTLAQVRRGVERALSNPAYLGRELNRLYHRRLYRSTYNEAGIDVYDADWDTLLVLDACRYDAFARHSDLPGELSRRTSRGSHTREFLTGNFAGRDLHDTVYVTASPMLYRWDDEIDAEFHHVYHVWREEGWDDRHGTVLPETTTAYARRALEEFPRKRLLVHYLQPHYPFVGAGETLNPRTFDGDRDQRDVWGELSRGAIDASRAEVVEAYRENLDLVLDAVADFLPELDGRTVVTSDHGNMFGERARPIPHREWGHPPGMHTPELVTVPWLTIDGRPRREIVAEPPAAAATSVSADVVTDRLEQLGYAE